MPLELAHGVVRADTADQREKQLAVKNDGASWTNGRV
jgi:hypothetical protein